MSATKPALRAKISCCIHTCAVVACDEGGSFYSRLTEVLVARWGLALCAVKVAAYNVDSTRHLNDGHVDSLKLNVAADDTLD